MVKITYPDRDVNQCTQNNVPADPLVNTIAQQEQDTPFKYVYDVFAGPKGKNLLHVILQKVIPLALFRTWAAMDSYQPAYGLLFVGVEQIAKDVRPQTRKIYVDLHEFEQRQLLVRRPGKVNKVASNQQKRWINVTFKDFTPLYDLAYDYYQWQLSADYIPPERAYLPQLRELLAAKPELTARLLRYEAYRAVLENRKPGPKKTAPTSESAQPESKCVRVGPDMVIYEHQAYRSFGSEVIHSQKDLHKDSQKGLNLYSAYRVDNKDITSNSDNSNGISIEKNLEEVSFRVSSSATPEPKAVTNPTAQVDKTKDYDDYMITESNSQLLCGNTANASDNDKTFNVTTEGKSVSDSVKNGNNRKKSSDAGKKSKRAPALSGKQKEHASIHKEKQDGVVMTQDELLRTQEFIEQFATDRQQRVESGNHAGGAKKTRRDAPAPCPPVTNVVSDIAHELNDQGGRSTLTRVLRLYWLSRMTPEDFIKVIYAARAKVRWMPDSRIKRRGPNGKANRAPIFLMLIERAIREGLHVLEPRKPVDRATSAVATDDERGAVCSVATDSVRGAGMNGECGAVSTVATENSTAPLATKEPLTAHPTEVGQYCQLPSTDALLPTTERLTVEPDGAGLHCQVPSPTTEHVTDQLIVADRFVTEDQFIAVAEPQNEVLRVEVPPIEVSPIEVPSPVVEHPVSPSASRHQRTMQALKDVRHLVNEPLRVAPEGQACPECGGIVKYSVYKCVVCQPAPTWSSRDHRRICKAIAKAEEGSM